MDDVYSNRTDNFGKILCPECGHDTCWLNHAEGQALGQLDMKALDVDIIVMPTNLSNDEFNFSCDDCGHEFKVTRREILNNSRDD